MLTVKMKLRVYTENGTANAAAKIAEELGAIGFELTGEFLLNGRGSRKSEQEYVNFIMPENGMRSLHTHFPRPDRMDVAKIPFTTIEELRENGVHTVVVKRVDGGIAVETLQKALLIRKALPEIRICAELGSTSSGIGCIYFKGNGALVDIM